MSLPALSLPRLADFRRIVIKVGSSLLVDQKAGRVNESWLGALADDVAMLHGDGRDVLIVSSGAIALGRSRLKLPRGPLKLEDSQGAAAIGQIALARLWSEVLGRLLDWRIVPVINENDTVATTEIRYGDNDRLAARVATMASADLLVLLSDIDGLYEAPPGVNPDAKLVPRVEAVSGRMLEEL